MATDFWAKTLPEPSEDWRRDASRLALAAEARRAVASYDTGSISEQDAYLLRALAEAVRAVVILEVGTFIGLSTTALASGSWVESVYTCDASNDCLPSMGVIHTFPNQSSTQMLRDLVSRGVMADLCFFDGVLSEKDADLLERVTYPGTVYAFHDYNYGPKIRAKHGAVTYETVPRKGIGNVQLLRPRLPRHTLVEPMDRTTLALMVPEHLL